MKTFRIIAVCIFALSLMGSGVFHQKRVARGDDGDTTRVQVSDWNRMHSFDAASSFFLREEFIGGTNATGRTGKLSWSFTALSGTSIRGAGVANHPGVLRLTSGGTANNYVALRLDSSTVGKPYLTPFDFEMVWILTPVQDTNDADFHVRFGFVDSSKADTIRPEDGIYVERLAGEKDIFGVTRLNDTQTRTSLGRFNNTAWYRVKIRYNDSATDTVAFSVNDGAEVAHTTNIPSANYLLPYIAVGNSGAASSNSVDLDYWHLMILNINR